MPTTVSIRVCALGLFVTAWALTTALWTADFARAADTRLAATSGRKAREAAVRAIPLDLLDVKERAAVESVLRRASIYRRMPTKVVESDPALFTLLIRNPHMIANMWEVLEMSKLRMIRTGKDAFHADDGNGARGTIRILVADYGEGARNRMLFYGEGTYEGKPFLRPVKTRCVFLLQSGAVRETNGHDYVTARLDSFVVVEPLGLDLLARTLHPLIGNVADKNFVDTMRFVGSFSQAAEKNPAGIARLARRLTRVSPEMQRELVDTAYAFAEASGDRLTSPVIRATALKKTVSSSSAGKRRNHE